MDTRHKFDDTLIALKTVSQHYPSESFASAVNSLSSFRDNFNVKVLFVGHFSAGKSALINGLISRKNFLLESQSPQTALATELSYTDGKEYYHAFTNDGTQVDVDPSDEFDATQYTHAEYLLNSEVLKQLQNYVIVDTPGFDSGIENHNKALTLYLGKGSAFILVSDIEKGTLDKRGISFLDEVSHYSDKIAVILNKCDKKTDEDIESIRSQVKDDLSIYGYDNVGVYCLSALDNELPSKLVELISAYNADEIFCTRMRRQIARSAVSMLKSIVEIKNTSGLDTYDIDIEIKKYRAARQQVKDSFDRMSKEIKDSSCSEDAQEVLFKVKSALDAHSMQIGKAIVGGSAEAAQAIIMETIRPVIINELKSISSTDIDSVIQEINMNTSSEAKQNTEKISDIVMNIAGSLKDAISDGTFEEIGTKVEEFKQERIRIKENKKKQEQKGKGLYQAVTGIAAITTNVIAPWLELIIILAPDIIRLIASIFGESEEQKAEKQVKNIIIPQVCSKLHTPLEEAVRSSRETILDSMKEMYDREFDSVTRSINQALEKKKTAEEAFSTMMNNIDADIKMLKQIIVEMGGDTNEL